MRIYLSAFALRFYGWKSFDECKDLIKNMYALTAYDPYSSFTYTPILKNRALFKDVLLDSGVFSYKNLAGSGISKWDTIDWAKHIFRYTSIIQQYKVPANKFFEMDVDYIVGSERVAEFRRKIEGMTGKQCIPVWHPIRGMKEFEREIEEYPFIALTAGDFKRSEYILSLLPLIEKAHNKGCKVHGLGIGVQALSTKVGRYNIELPFDSIDCTSYITGGRYGRRYKFTGDRFVQQYYDVRKGDYKTLNILNLKEFLKVSEYYDA